MSCDRSAITTPRPHVSADSRMFWEGCRQKQLKLPFCSQCGKAHLPPGPVCPHCFGCDLEWHTVSGRATISTWTVLHKAWLPAFADHLPYNVVQVELEEGPRLTSTLRGLDNRTPRVGEKVIVDFEIVDDQLTLPVFRPA